MTLIDRVIEIEQHELGYHEAENGWTKFGQVGYRQIAWTNAQVARVFRLHS